MDDVGDTLADATILSSTGEQVFNRSIEAVGDVDVYRITLAAGQTVEVVLEGTGFGSALGFGLVAIGDTAGNPLDGGENLEPGDSETTIFQAPEAGDYLIIVEGDDFAGTDLGTGTYTLRVRPDTALRDPEGDLPPLALPITGFGTTTHTIATTDDEDLFTLDVQQGDRIRVELEPDGADPLSTALLGVAKASGELVQSGAYSNGEGTRIEFEAPETGSVIIGVVGQDESENMDTGGYRLTVAAAEAVDVGDSFADALVLANAGAESLDQRIDTPTDRDVYSIDLTAGQTVAFEVQMPTDGDLRGLGRLDVFDADGAFLERENVFRGDPGDIVFEAPETGTYFAAFRVVDLIGEPATAGAYRLLVRPDTTLRDPEGDTDALALTLPDFGTTTHTILNDNDRDVLVLTTTPGQRVQIEIEGTGADPLEGGSLQADFESVEFSSRSGTTLQADADASGEVFITVLGAFGSGQRDSGGYQLTVSPVVLPPVDLVASANLLFPPDDTGQALIVLALNNLGFEVQDNVNFSVVLTEDEVIDAGDLVLETAGPLTLGAEGVQTATVPITIPSDVADGTYRLAVVADPDDLIAEADETNNVGFTESFPFGTFEPDLAIGTIELSDADNNAPGPSNPISQGDVVRVAVFVENLGNLETGAFDVQFALGFPGNTQALTATTAVTSIQPFSATTVEASIRVPAGFQFDSGQGSVVVVLDPEAAVPDTNIVNNIAAPVEFDVLDVLTDDHGDSVAAGTPITEGETLGGIINAADINGSDSDIFTFTANAGARFRFTLTPDDTVTSAITAARGDVIGPDGGRAQFGAFGTDDATLDTVRPFAPVGESIVLEGIAQATGTQAVEVHTRFLSGLVEEGGYALSFDSLEPDAADDHSDAREGATVLTGGAVRTGVLNSLDDVDVFAFDRGGVSALTFRVTKTGGTGSEGVTVQVVDTDSEPSLFRTTATEVFAGATVSATFEKTLSGLPGDGPTFFAVSGPVGAYEIEVIQHAITDSPRLRFDGTGLDDLPGTAGSADTFVMQDDDERDLIRSFEFGLDRIDVSNLGAEELSDLLITNQTRGNGSVSWVNIADQSGNAEIAVRFGDGTPLDASAFTADDFIFLPATARTTGIVQQDSAGFDDFRGVAGAEVYVLQDDGVLDLIRAFQFGIDQIDVSAFAESIGDLTISNQTRGDGSVKWVTIADFRGDSEVAIRFGDGTPLDAAALSASDFIFSDTPLQRDQTIQDTDGFTDLSGADTRDTFVMLDDGTRDLIRAFDIETDVIDVSDFAESLADLTISNQLRGNGSVSWVSVADFDGEVEMALRFDGGVLDAGRLTADNFIFSEEPIDRAPRINVLTDTEGFSDLRATSGSDVFVMQYDDARDLIRGFQPGVDKIDLADYALSSFGGDVVARNLERRDGSVNWVEVFVDRFGVGVGPDQEADFAIRFDGGTVLDESNLSADDFVF